MKKNRSALILTTMVDKNGVSRQVWRRPEDWAGAKPISLPSVAPGSSSTGSDGQDTHVAPIDRIVSGLMGLFRPSPERAEAVDAARSHRSGFAMRDTELRTLVEIFEVPKAPHDLSGEERDRQLKKYKSEAEISVIHANREFLSKNLVNPKLLVELAAVMGPHNMDPDGRIHNIEAHVTAAQGFSNILPTNANGQFMMMYVDAEGLWTAINEHPELVEPLTRWGKEASAAGMDDALLDSDKSREITATLLAHPEQHDKVIDFVMSRGTGFSQESYEGFESQHDAIEEGWL